MSPTTDLASKDRDWRVVRDALQVAISLAVFALSARQLARSSIGAPFLFLFLLATVLALGNAALAKTLLLRRTALVGAGISVALLLVEGGFKLWDAVRPIERISTAGSYTEPGYSILDHELGYAPTPGVTVRSRRFTQKRPIYDATYGISPEGARRTKGDPQGPTWLFMGCSRTFGEGVNDDETLPSRFSRELDHKANVLNLGFHGYGPHQMLRMLELGRLGGASVPVERVVYQAIVQHVPRAAGRASWDLRGPYYEKSGDTVIYTGPFRTARHASLLRFARRSEMARHFMDRLYHSDIDDEGIERFARIVERSARLAREKLGAEFTVLYWDEDSPRGRRMRERLEKTGVDLVLGSQLIPRSDWKKLRFPVDPHPTAEEYRRAAQGLAAHFRSSGVLAAPASNDL